MTTYYITDAQVKGAFFRGASSFPSDSTVDTTTHDEWMLDVYNYINEKAGVTSLQTDKYGTFKRLSLKAYRNCLEKGYPELTKDDIEDLEGVVGNVPLQRHDPNDYDED